MILAAFLCGSMTFRISVPPAIQIFWHSTDCRAATGAPFARTMIFNSQGVKTTGELARLSFDAASGSTTNRHACKACGGVVSDISEQYADLIGVLAHSNMAFYAFHPTHHIWLQSRANKGRSKRYATALQRLLQPLMWKKLRTLP